MKRCTKCGAEKELTEFSKGNDPNGLQYQCRACAKAYAKDYYTKHFRKYRVYRTREESLALKRGYEKKRMENPELRKRHSRQAWEWQRRHPEVRRHKENRRRAAKGKGAPRWANQFIIKEFYSLSVLRTKITGIKHHVDHIVPLHNPLVCGLHTHANLQILESRSNVAKSNRSWPDMPE